MKKKLLKVFRVDILKSLDLHRYFNLKVVFKGIVYQVQNSVLVLTVNDEFGASTKSVPQ